MTTVLVVEDDGAMRNAIAEILELAGYAVLTAEDGLAGVAAARANWPDIIVCDVVMRFLDGYGVLEELRHDAATAMIPFIFLTARSAQSDIRHGMALGADDYLTKPFSDDDLLRAVRARLDKQAQLNKGYRQRLDNLRSALAGSLPHEFLTPLQGILAGAACLQEDFDTLTRPDREDLLDIVVQSGQRLHRLVENYLLYADLTVLDHDRTHTGERRQATTAALSPIRTSAQEEAAAVHRASDLQLDLEDAVVAIPAHHLGKIVQELVSNAAKFSLPGSPLHLTTRRTGDGFILTVTDHGRGMTAAEIATIGAFQQFQRKFFEQQGAGLGLALVRQLAAQYGGACRITSAPGKGATVEVILPLSMD